MTAGVDVDSKESIKNQQPTKTKICFVFSFIIQINVMFLSREITQFNPVFDSLRNRMNRKQDFF